MARPPGYERSDVLNSATDVFWQRGYGATSISDLVAATGLKPGSIYAAFGSKKGLFLEVLEEYHGSFMASLEESIAAAPTPLKAIEALLQRMANDTLGNSGTRGCLAVNALLEMAEHDKEIAARLRADNAKLRQRLERLLRSARAEGELHQEKDPAQLADFLLNNLWGMRVLCKGAPTRVSLDSIVSGVMAGITAKP